MIARRPLPPRGMALIAVLWIVAALAMLVAGTTQSVRQQIRVVAQGRDAVVIEVGEYWLPRVGFGFVRDLLRAYDALDAARASEIAS